MRRTHGLFRVLPTAGFRISYQVVRAALHGRLRPVAVTAAMRLFAIHKPKDTDDVVSETCGRDSDVSRRDRRVLGRDVVVRRRC